MVTPSDSSDEQIRCGMCGKPNPPDADVCQHCGSRLKPVTSPDELTDISAESPDDVDDLFDAMRAQFEDTGGKPPQTPLPEQEMDFSFGSSDSDDEDALPSFLRDRPAQPSSETSDDLADWFSEPEATGESSEPDIDDSLDWLYAADSEGPQVEPEETPQTPGTSQPDWLSEFDRMAQPEASPETTESQDDLPGWLSELTGAPGEPRTPQESEPETDDLGWLSEYAADDEPDTLIVDTGMPEVEETGKAGPDKEPRPSAGDDAVPDWFADLAPGAEAGEEASEAEQPSEETAPPPLPGGTLPGPLVEDATPSWLIQQRADEAAEEAAASAADSSPAVSEPVEDEEIPEAAPEQPEPITPEVEEEAIPEWLAGLEDEEEEAAPEWLTSPAAEEEPAADTQPSAETEAVPDWMAELNAESVPQEEVEPAREPEAEAEPEPVPAIEVDEEDISLDWLEDVEDKPEAEEEEDWLAALDFSDEPVAPIGEDLLGLLSEPSAEADEGVDEAAESSEEQKVAKAVDFGDLPEWLQGMGEMAGMALPDSERPLTPSDNVSAEELAEIQDLRYEALTGQDRDQRREQTESVGALKDVRGVIQPELIFEGSTLAVTEPVQQVIVTPAQAQQVEQVQRLLQYETATFTASEAGLKLPIVRWLVALVILLAVAGSLIGRAFILPAPQPAPSVTSAYQAIEGMTAIDAVVLVAFEYGPDAAGEMNPLAEALLWHMAQKPNVTVLTISTQPTGPAMADAILRRGGIQPRLAANGGTWQNLGYVSGGINGVSSLAGRSAIDISSPFSFDNAGRPTGLAATSLQTASVDQMIVVAARPDDARMWIEQASQPTGIPLIAAVGASAAPLLRPYASSGQVAGLLVGLNDAVAYWRLGGQQVGQSLLSRYNAQAIGSLAATALILIGGIVYGILSLRNRKEGL